MPGQGIVTIRDKQWSVSIASTPWELAQGLGAVGELPNEYGMFFDTGWEQYIEVTTETMLFTLDVAFLSSSLEVVDLVQYLAPGHRITSTQPARYFLEVNAGELEGLEIGDQADLELVPLVVFQEQPDLVSAIWNLMMTVLPLVIVGSFAVGVVKAGTSNPGSQLPQGRLK